MNLSEKEKQKLKTRTAIPFWFHTLKHKALVLGYILRFCVKIIWRGIFHDLSKFSLYEGRSYGKFIPEFKKVKYGTAGYDEILKKFQPAIDHHYHHNRHHPQHFKGGYSSMNLLDFMEMFFDWKAASKKNLGTGSLKKSLPINAKRFKMSDDIQKLMLNSLNL